MNVRRVLMIALAVLMAMVQPMAPGGWAEGAGRSSVIGSVEGAASDGGAASGEDAAPAGSAASGGRELSACYGRAIDEAAGEIGGLTFEAGEEFSANYTSDALALRGNGGRVSVIELRAGNAADTLCGVGCGMTQKEARALMEGCPLLWEYDEELAWLIRADAEDKLKDETLVVFFDESGRVRGAWYRSGEA